MQTFDVNWIVYQKLTYSFLRISHFLSEFVLPWGLYPPQTAQFNLYKQTRNNIEYLIPSVAKNMYCIYEGFFTNVVRDDWKTIMDVTLFQKIFEILISIRVITKILVRTNFENR